MRAGGTDHSFPRDCRLATSEEFRRVYRSGWRGRAGPFSWHARENTCGHPRLGLAVPKRVLKRAADRSRVKRLIRESFRHNRSRLASVDIVVSVKDPPRNLYDPALGRIISRIWDSVSSGGGAA